MKALLLLVGLPLVAAAASASTVVANIAVPGTPCGVGEAAGAVWVSKPVGAKLVGRAPATTKVTKTVPTGVQPCELRFAAGSLWVVTQSNKLDRFDPATGRRVESVELVRLRDHP